MLKLQKAVAFFWIMFLGITLSSQENKSTNTVQVQKNGFRSGIPTVSFVPAQPFPGDRVEMRYEIQSPGVSINTEFKTADFIQKSALFDIEFG